MSRKTVRSWKRRREAEKKAVLKSSIPYHHVKEEAEALERMVVKVKKLRDEFLEISDELSADALRIASRPITEVVGLIGDLEAKMGNNHDLALSGLAELMDEMELRVETLEENPLDN